MTGRRALRVASCVDLLPSFSASVNLVKLVLEKEDGLEEAVYRRTDHRFFEEVENGLSIKELCRRHSLLEASYYHLRSKFGDMNVSDAKRLKELETENTRLKKLLAGAMLGIKITQRHSEKSVKGTGMLRTNAPFK